MGIDIYARYRAQTDNDLHDQDRYYATTEGGHLGYLREAYHGEPYVTRFLCREAFESGNGEALIPATVLRQRLPEAIRLAAQRERDVYHETSARNIRDVCDNYTAFVEFCEHAEWKIGEPVTVVASY